MNDMIVRKEAIFALRPNSKWHFTTDGSIVWIDEEQTEPTSAEIDAHILATQYQRDRQYPQLGEQLDMLFHDMTADKGTKDGEWYKAIAKVKTDNPKE